MNNNKDIKIKDVARLAGVSTATVSRVFNNKSGFSLETKRKVEQAIKELNYQPNFLARALKSNVSKIIAVSIPTIWHPFFAEFLFHVEQILSQYEYNMMVSSNNSDINREKAFLKMITENKIDGIIAISYNEIAPYLTINIPFVSIDRYFDVNNYKKLSVVTSDNYKGGEIAFNELFKRNVTSFAFLGTYAKYPNNAMLRKKGFLAAANKHNITPKVFEALEKSLDDDLLIDKFMENIEDIDGVFVVNDETALKLLYKLNQRMIAIPEDLQIIGFDGFNYLNNIPSPISSITQSAKIMAQLAVETVIAIINGEPVPQQKHIPVTFREGKTTKNDIIKKIFI